MPSTPFSSERGQESAPFELLIAIIVMSFVIVVGFNALDTLNRETCKGTLNDYMEGIKLAVETVVKNESTATVAYRLPECYNENESKMRIIERDDTVYCSAVCEGSLAQCTVLQFYSPEYTVTKCLRISSATTFPEGDPCDTTLLEPQDSYAVANWKNQDLGIQTGNYTLLRQSNLFSSAPVICVYRRV